MAAVVVMCETVSSWAVSTRFTKTLALKGIGASIGSIGDAFDNYVADSTIGPFKNEAIHDNSPFRKRLVRSMDDV